MRLIRPGGASAVIAVALVLGAAGGTSGFLVEPGAGSVIGGALAAIGAALVCLGIPHWLAHRGPASELLSRVRGGRPRLGVAIIGAAVSFTAFWMRRSLESIFPLLRDELSPPATLSTIASDPDGGVAIWRAHPSAGQEDAFVSALGVVNWITAIEILGLLAGAGCALIVVLRWAERTLGGLPRQRLNRWLQAGVTMWLTLELIGAIARVGVVHGHWHERSVPGWLEVAAGTGPATVALLVLLPVVVLTPIVVIEAVRVDRPGIGARLRQLRIVIAALVVQAALLLVVPLQIPDYLLALVDRSVFLTPMVVVLVTAGVGVLFAEEARTTTGVAPTPAPLPPGHLVRAGIGLGAIGAICWVLGLGWGLLIPAAFLIVLGVASLALEQRSPRPPRPVAAAPHGAPPGTRLTPVFAALPPLLLGVAIARWSFAEAVYVQGDTGADAAFSLVAFLVLTAVALAVAYRHDSDHEVWAAVRRGLTGMLILVLVALPFSVQYWGEFVGAVSVVEASTALAALGVGSLVRFADRWEPPIVLREFGFRRQPVILGLVAWGTVATLVGSPGTFDVRPTIPLEPRPDPGEVCDTELADGVATADGLFDRWRTRNRLPPAIGSAPSSTTSVGEPDQREAVPLVIVSASGGGIRAAWWTARVMTEIFGDETLPGPCSSAPPASVDRVLFASGLSGGSLGLAAYDVALLHGDADDAGWVLERLGDDYVTPTIGWLLTVEVPRSFLRFPIGQDRAEVLERSWERSWADLVAGPDGTIREEAGPHELEAGLRSITRNHPEVPVLVLNGATVRDGCVLMATEALTLPSPRYARESDCHRPPTEGTLPGVLPLPALICDEDVRLSTAALLSARFPAISPSGRLPGCQGFATQVVDGGYIDSSAAGQALTIWDAIEPMVSAYNATSTTHCIAPTFLQIDNGFELSGPVSTPGVVSELLAPIQAALSSYGRESLRSRAEAAARFDSGFIRVAPQARPGLSPALGWTLSGSSMALMESAVTSSEPVVSVIAQARRALESTASGCR